MVYVCSLECVLLRRISCSVRGSYVLHCEVLQLPLYIGWEYGWCGMPRIACVCVCACVCACAVEKMAKDIGMTICTSIVVSFLPCSVAFLAFHPYMFFYFLKCFLLLVSVAFGGGGGGGGENHGSL